MEAERPSLGDRDGTGSWHPAMRPDSNTVGSDGLVQDSAVEGDQGKNVNNDARLPNLSSKPTVVLEEPLNFGGGRGPLIEESQPPIDDGANLERVQDQEIESKNINGISGHSMDPPFSDVHLPQAQLMDQEQRTDSTAIRADSQTAQYLNADSVGQNVSAHEFVIEQQSELVVDSEYTQDISAREQLDNAFKSEPDREHTNSHPALDRTNSFPEVPPLTESTISPAHALSKSQAEDIMEDDKALDHHQGSFDDDAVPRGIPDAIADNNDVDFFANFDDTSTGQTSAPLAEDEMRYEEGLPLVPSKHLQEVDKLPALSSDLSRETAQTHSTEDDIEFPEGSGPSPVDSSSRPQPLDRKTTTQVLDAMHYAPHGTTSKEVREDKPPLADMAGGAVAGSALPVDSEDLAKDPLQPVHSNSKEDDLAELWKAALGDDEILNDDEAAMDPSVLFGDDEGFLDDLTGQDEEESKAPFYPLLEAVHNADGGSQGSGGAEQRSISTANRYVPVGANQSQQSNLSTKRQNQHGGTPNPPLPRAFTGPETSITTPVGSGWAGATVQQPYAGLAPPRPHMPASTQSFADKSKGGYTSPYDLPMDITRPKKRSQAQHNTLPDLAAPDLHARVPPPRSSSMFTGPPPSSQPQSTIPSVPHSGPVPVAVNPTPPQLKPSQSTSSFFEDLAPKPRPSTSVGKYTPPPSHHQVPHATPMAPSMSRQASIDGYSQQAGVHTAQAYQLRQPEKLSLFGSTPPQQSSNQPLPAINSRYSPAPHQPSNVPPSRTRYASSPMGPSQPPIETSPFQPRTSSPLAQSSLPRQSTYTADPLQGHPASDGQRPHAIARPSAPQVAYPPYQEQGGPAPSAEHSREMSPPLANSRYAPLSDSPSSGSQVINTPSTDRVSSDGLTNHQNPPDISMQAFGGHPRMPPQRSQTQSPGAARASQEVLLNQAPYQRPASVSDRRAPVSTLSPSTAVPQRTGRSRGSSEAINYITPTDGRETDPLERWKGCPILTFGFGGTVVTSFPVRIPRYAAGQKTPLVKCSPGEVEIRGSRLLTLDDNIATFPGPLRSKSKKKEVMEWLHNRIRGLENSTIPIPSINVLPDPLKCHQEKILLWKTLRVLVEHDGTVDGNPAAEQAVRVILSPELESGDAATIPTNGMLPPSSGIVRHGGSINKSENVDQGAMEELRRSLLQGDREKAIWLAVDNRMWAHAMLIATTLDPKIWKQISSEFIKQEVKSYGENTESLSALYQIFSGNGEESIDELVPPSARAGLQMISKVASNGPTKNALDGLDRWRETLTLIMSNRTPEDGKALVSLGQLLAGYGRTEAAHISYIFAKSPSLFGGPDDPQVSIALLGADHIRQPSDYGRDMDSILMTEVYEFALTTLASSSAVTVSPHLQAYKLYHAMLLAEHGHKTEAQQYCDAITGALKSTTKLSPYYHPLLFGAFENLTERLRQAPKDGSGSWISRPSIDKVSGSIWAKFNSYVAGDESDAASTGSGLPNEVEAGPFARITGDSPNISRSPSVGDLYGSHSSGLGLAPAATPTTQPVNSRYAPAGLYTPRSSQEQARNSSQEPQRRDSVRTTYVQQQHQSRSVASNVAIHEPHKPQFRHEAYAPQQESGLPTPPIYPKYTSEAPPDQLPRPDSFSANPPYAPPLHSEQHESSFEEQPTRSTSFASGYQPSSSSYEPPPTSVYGSSAYEPPSSAGYEPPTDSGYEPQSYEPPSYNAGTPQTTSPTEEKRRMGDLNEDADDDNDFEARAAATKKAERARKDREADELMRKAAEEDGRLSINSLHVKLSLIVPQPEKIPIPNSTARNLAGSAAGWAALKNRKTWHSNRAMHLSKSN